nr:hypothetical protein [Mycoplasmopsis bovis]
MRLKNTKKSLKSLETFLNKLTGLFWLQLSIWTVLGEIMLKSHDNQNETRVSMFPVANNER